MNAQKNADKENKENTFVYLTGADDEVVLTSSLYLGDYGNVIGTLPKKVDLSYGIRVFFKLFFVDFFLMCQIC